jgi:hypothetical protein
MRGLSALAVWTGLLLIPNLRAESLQLVARELPSAIIGLSYDAPIRTLSDGRCPANDVALSLLSGALPRGIDLTPTGLSGVPKEMGVFRFTVRAANGCESATRAFALFVTGRPILLVSPADLVFECRAGGPAPQPQTVLVSSSWANLPYSVAGNPEWLSLEISAAMTPGPNAALSGDPVSVRVAPAKLAPGTYKTTLVFSAWRAANAPAVSVTLKVIADR